jgi:hypothetical protein
MRLTCPSCGVTVDLVQDESGNKIPLETFPEQDSGHTRYVILETGPPTIARAVSKNAPGSHFADHRFDCPGHNAGLPA